MERNEVVEEQCPPRELDVKSRKQHWRREGSMRDKRQEQMRGRFRCEKPLMAKLDQAAMKSLTQFLRASLLSSVVSIIVK